MNAVGIDVAKGKNMVSVVQPFGKLGTNPYEVRHTAGELRELGTITLKKLEGETRVALEHTDRLLRTRHEPGGFHRVLPQVV